MTATFVKLLAVMTLAGVLCAGCAHVKPDSAAVSAAAPAIRGMKVETPDGAVLGRIQDIIVDGYGRARFAIVSYGGSMGFGARYTAIPWATVAAALDRNRLVLSRSDLQSAPLLLHAKPQFDEEHWRREAERFWAEKVAALAAPAPQS